MLHDVRVLTKHRLRALGAAAFGGIVSYDLLQRRRAILRNFPVVGLFRYLLEASVITAPRRCRAQ